MLSGRKKGLQKTLTGMLWGSFILEVALEGGCKDGPVCGVIYEEVASMERGKFSHISWDFKRTVEFPLSLSLLNITDCDKDS